MTITSIAEMPASVFAADVVVSVGAEANLWEIAAALTAADVGLVVVGSTDAVRGVVSERDLARALAARRDPTATTAADIAHTEVIWCDIESTVAEVAEEMMEHYVRHVLVEADGRLVGIVSARDLLGAYVSVEDVANDGRGSDPYVG
jgi:CBS domain-containing protein